MTEERKKLSLIQKIMYSAAIPLSIFTGTLLYTEICKSVFNSEEPFWKLLFIVGLLSVGGFLFTFWELSELERKEE